MLVFFTQSTFKISEIFFKQINPFSSILCLFFRPRQFLKLSFVQNFKFYQFWLTGLQPVFQVSDLTDLLLHIMDLLMALFIMFLLLLFQFSVQFLANLALFLCQLHDQSTQSLAFTLGAVKFWFERIILVSLQSQLTVYFFDFLFMFAYVVVVWETFCFQNSVNTLLQLAI